MRVCERPKGCAVPELWTALCSAGQARCGDLPASTPCQKSGAPATDPQLILKHILMFDSIVKDFTSLKLTVICLGLAMVLIFIGTIAQRTRGGD